MTAIDPVNILHATREVVIAAIAANTCSANDIPDLIWKVNAAFVAAADYEPIPAPSAPVAREPATTVRKSLASPDHILSMIDGKPYRTLRRHLTTHGMTPETYRETFNLPSDYPMVARSYSEQRRAMAKKIGLGQRGTGAPAAR